MGQILQLYDFIETSNSYPFMIIFRGKYKLEILKYITLTIIKEEYLCQFL